jgi:catechol 2,3-dioxygenase-like lactoylglutathione lyase family enzyme
MAETTRAKRRLAMLANSRAYSGFAVDDIAKARQFYTETLGLTVSNVPGAPDVLATLQTGGDGRILIYEKPDFAPATYTILNFPVEDINKTVDELTARGVTFQRYEGMAQDERGIALELGPPIAWFTDPAGNILAVIQE